MSLRWSSYVAKRGSKTQNCRFLSKIWTYDYHYGRNYFLGSPLIRITTHINEHVSVKNETRSQVYVLSTSILVDEDVKLSWRETERDCSQLWTYSHAVTYCDSLCESEASVVTVSAIITAKCFLISWTINCLVLVIKSLPTLWLITSLYIVSNLYNVSSQPLKSTQPGHPFVGERSEYDDALRLGSKGR